jgi:DNA recombination protein RmuC
MMESLTRLGLTPGEAVAAVMACIVIVVAIVALAARRRRVREAEDLDRRLADLARNQAEMAGRLGTIADVFGSRQSDFARAVSERLDGFSQRLGTTMVETTRATHESLSRLHERIAVIDRAQASIAELSGRVVDLRAVLADKQSRGAFGQGRMEAIVEDALPPNAFTFQATLSTGVRPDCLIHLPNGAAPLVIDAKFPLEGWTAYENAGSPEETAAAATRFRRDVARHIQDIAGKYLIAGETQDTAFLFVPSESIFASLHEGFSELIQRAHRARVVIVSPSLLVLSIQVVQSVLRDQRIRDEAHRIQSEVVHLLDDVEAIRERVGKLRSHFGQTTKDLDEILVSADKLKRRANRIESLDLTGEAAGTTREPSGHGDPQLPLDRRDRLAGE